MKGFSVPLHLLYEKVKYQLQYVDYSANEWTAPCILTEERAEKFCNDHSVTKVKIITDNQEWIIDLVNPKSSNQPITKSSNA